MKAVSFALLAALAACKSESKPAAKQAPAAEGSAPVAHVPGTAPALPAEGGGGDEDRPELPAGDHRRPIDTDGDGVISPQEREAAREARAKRMVDRFDTNHDGKLTTDELAAGGSGMRGRFMDAKSADKNNDGEISPAELEAAIQERRMQWRAHRGHAGSGSAADAVNDE
jgi:hypothetical protein